MKYRLIRLAVFIVAVMVLARGEADADEFAFPDEQTSAGSALSIHGYGELHYNNPDTGSSVPDSDDPAQMDMHRMVWGVSYHYNERISLHTEVDFEHAATAMELEFAYLDFLIQPAFNVRAGSMLMPVGPLNEFHEPTLFYSVERPYVNTYIIPTTWNEGGAGIFGSPVHGVKYRLYIVSGLDASGFSSGTGIRGGRSKVAEAPADDLAVVGRIEYVGLPGLQLGLSGYRGDAAQGDDALGDAGVTILEADFKYRLLGFELSGLYALITINDAEAISTALGSTIGEELVGMYVEGAYHLLPLLIPDTNQDVVVFVRWEQFNTQEEVPSGLDPDPANDRTIITFGGVYYPIPQVALKADFERWKDDAPDSTGNRFNLGLAYMF
jgi:hypothetical protein